MTKVCSKVISSSFNYGSKGDFENDVNKSDSLTDAELLRYSRQVLLDGWDIDAQLQLKNSQVVIIGAGGLGCPVSEVLARAGVGHIHLIDDDDIEISNLQRQTLFTLQDVGAPKAKVAQQRLQTINEYVNVSCEVVRITETNIDSHLSFMFASISTATHTQTRPVLLLDCTDNFTIREILNRFSVKHKIPLLSASAIAMSGQLALFEPEQATGCYHCVFGSTQARTHSSSSIDNTQATQNTEASCVNSGVLASTTAVMGSLQANAALQYLGMGVNPLRAELLLWDGKRMQQRRIRYRKDKHCPVCG